MTNASRLVLLLIGNIGLWGAACAIEDPRVADAKATIESDNGLNLNGLNLNGLGYQTVEFQGTDFNPVGYDGTGWDGATNYNGLNHAGLETNEVWKYWMTSGAYAEQESFFRYLVECALADGQTIAAIEIEGQPHGPWSGVLGMAPAWYAAGNDHQTPVEQERVTACLAAHVNAVGASVLISVRSHDGAPASPAEIADFGLAEGHFFGNVLSVDPKVGACRATAEPGAATDAELTERDRLCALDPSGCSFQDFGPCDTTCSGFDADQGVYATCAGYSAVAVHLASASP